MVTVHDVARAAGVSISTVSRALAMPERVAESTRTRVVLAAQELGYRPNSAASRLRAGRTGAVGFVVPDLENPYFASLTKGAQARARACGYAVLVADTGEDPELEVELVTGMGPQIDGLVLCSPRAAERDLDAVGAVPLVLVNRELGVRPSVTANDVSGMRQAVEHLRALGHRCVAYVGGPARSWSDARRRAGLDQAVRELPDVRAVQLGAFRPHVAGGHAAADLVVASGATAVVAYNDLVAIGLIERLRARGLDVPRDLSVVGWDDTFVATLASPELTSVGADLPALGAVATDVVLESVRRSRRSGAGAADAAGADGESGGQVRVPVELVVRASTGIAP
ncbi:LacI family DNA-binding transcriptional regulator [Jiangella asiatica]|uniref:LacI family transcriptional regulator n=1 Tax=Jiangella asiatica TaxID=2530372 RepID=A0A4R5DUP3_9ACTN|nr:LacI family DNA-binding transcriptional regulator [Jiangella asiatica]TDE16050.1 LacI family transcriptional regulator [Jiangella asiatica]